MNSRDRSSFLVPQSFDVYLVEHQKKLKQKSKQEQQKIAKEQREKTAREKLVKRRARENLKYAQRIFDWVDQFKESDMGKRTFAELPAKYRPDQRLFFFRWRPTWGYGLSMYGKCDGVHWHRNGPGSITTNCMTPDKLALQAEDWTPGMLKACCAAIESGDVWKFIKEELDLFTKD